MEMISAQAFVAVAAIVAALIAGFFSFINLINSKEQKVSEFRQQWINELRQEIASYTAAVTYLSISYEAYHEENNDDKGLSAFYESVKDQYEMVVVNFTSILLRINPNEKKKDLAKMNQDFIEAVHTARRHFNEVKLIESRHQCNVIREMSIPLLKVEWERVKKGEFAYRASKFFAAIILLTGLMVGFAILAHGIKPSSQKATGETSETLPSVRPAVITPQSAAAEPKGAQADSGIGQIDGKTKEISTEKLEKSPEQMKDAK